MNKNLLSIVFVGLLLFGSASITLYAQEAIGKVLSLEGTAEAKLDENATWRQLNVKSDVYENDTIKTGKYSKVVIFFIDETKISIGSETTIKIKKFMCSPAQNHREGKLNVIAGKARFDLGKFFSKGSSFEVQTPTAVAGVKGTSFIVHVTSEQLTQLLGLSGTVTVTSISPEIGGEVLLTGGFIISVEDGAPPGDPVPITFDELLDFLKDLGLFDGEGNKGQAAGGVFGNTLLQNLGDFTPPTGQDIIDQPLEGPGGLPEPPAPPTDEDNEYENGYHYEIE